jgi:hypothetical protein
MCLVNDLYRSTHTVEKGVSFFNKICHIPVMQSLGRTIFSRICGHGRGWAFTPIDFLDVAGPRTVGVILGRLVSQGKIKRLARGLYFYPNIHPTLGTLLPSVDEIAKAVAGRDRLRLLPTGAYAANQLGLSTQVPGKVVFLTDGKPRKLSVGKLTIELRKAAPRHMLLAGKESGVVIQALRYLGADHIDTRAVQKLADSLPANVKRELIRNLSAAPAWMRPFLKDIAGAS